MNMFIELAKLPSERMLSLQFFAIDLLRNTSYNLYKLHRPRCWASIDPIPYRPNSNLILTVLQKNVIFNRILTFSINFLDY